MFLVRLPGFSPRTMKRDECELTWSARATGVARRVASRRESIHAERPWPSLLFSLRHFLLLPVRAVFPVRYALSPTPLFHVDSHFSLDKRTLLPRVPLYAARGHVAFSSGKVAACCQVNAKRAGEAFVYHMQADDEAVAREIRHERKSVIVKKSLFAVFARPLGVPRRNE